MPTSITTAEAITRATDLLVNWVWPVEAAPPAPDRLDVTLKEPKELIPMVTALRVQRLGYLAAITGLDLGPEDGRLEILYHFCIAAAVITIRVPLPREGATIESLTDLIPGAEPYERELSEMFGVDVVGMRNPLRLYLPDDWPDGVYPLRKDFDPAVLHNHHKEQSDAAAED
jgi:Ni,Fe-hydrogenase III component G